MMIKMVMIIITANDNNYSKVIMFPVILFTIIDGRNKNNEFGCFVNSSLKCTTVNCCDKILIESSIVHFLFQPVLYRTNLVTLTIEHESVAYKNASNEFLHRHIGDFLL